MLFTFHTPTGVVTIDSNTVTDGQLAQLNITRDGLNELVQNQRVLGYPDESDPDTITARELLGTSPDVITQPEIWQLLRIYGRRLGYIEVKK